MIETILIGSFMDRVSNMDQIRLVLVRVERQKYSSWEEVWAVADQIFARLIGQTILSIHWEERRKQGLAEKVDEKKKKSSVL